MYALINIAGLGLGIACAVIIFSLIKYHLSFDNFHPEADKIYRITTELNIGEIKDISGVPAPLAAAFKNDYPFAETIASIYTSEHELVTITRGTEQKKFEEDLAFAEPEFFRIFSFPLLKGDWQSAMNKPNSVVLTESLSVKYFGSTDPMGKTIRIANKADFTISGIMKDLPANTGRREQIYIPFANLKDLQPWMVSDFWVNVNDDRQCFIKLKPNVSATQVDKIFPAFVHKYYSEKDAKEWKFQLQPLADIHLNKSFGASIGRESLVALGCIGLFLVLAACINFINLATAQATSRFKEIGVRKVLGSSRPQLFWQFIIETSLIGLIAMALALVLSEVALPYINQLFDARLSFNIFSDIYLAGFLVTLLLVMVFSSGFYPGLIMAGIEPVLALKGKLSHSSSGSVSLRKALVITQFAISQLLIIGTIVIVSQMRYAQQADMGFVKDGIVMLPVPDNQPSKIKTLKEQFLKIPGVKDMTFCYAPPAQESASSSRILFASRTEDEKFTISCRYADHDYTSVFGLHILAGRNLLPADTVREFLVNSSTVRLLGLKSNDEVLGKKATINGYKGTIVGVINDFHNKSFHSVIEPLALTSFFVWYGKCAVKVDASNMKATLSQLEATWQEAYPNSLYKQDFLDEKMTKLYEADQTMMTLVQVFTCIAIFIGCLSLYGLAAFMAAQKKKEVAVRKVLGASVQSIVLLFGKEFSRLMLFAFAIATPLGWWVMQSWLSNFAYRIDIGAGIFIVALLITFTVVMFTVGYKSIKTALADPAKSLRSE